MNPKQVTRDFSTLYYQSRAYSKITWRGIPILQYASDLWIYAELIHRVQPQVVVETGTFAGGSALFAADMLGLLGNGGQVVTIDVEDWSGAGGLPDHPAITYLRGSSVDPLVVADVLALVGGRTCLVVLDSNHSAEHVALELACYAELVSVGSYLIVQDTCVHDVMPDYPPGPDDALAAWLPDHPNFVVDRDCERLLLGQSPGGWLRRVR